VYVEWRKVRGSVTGVRRECAGAITEGRRGPVLERSGICVIGYSDMAEVSNHAGPRPVSRGSKSTHDVDFEPRKPLTGRIPSHLRRIRHRGDTDP